MKQNPTWLDANYLPPRFHNHPTENLNDKIFCLQNFIQGATGAQLRAAGVSDVWENVFDQVVSPSGSGLKACSQLSTSRFGSGNPTQTRVEQEADLIDLFQGKVISHEFAEGDYGQPSSTDFIFSQRIKQRADAMGITVNQVGEYGFHGSQAHQDWKQDNETARAPMSQYFLDLLDGNIGSKLEGGNLKDYMTNGLKDVRGTTINLYYSFKEYGGRYGNGDWMNTIPVQAMYHYNDAPNQTLLGFTWPKMQSTTGSVDITGAQSSNGQGVEREGGTIRPNGSKGIDFPSAPMEVMKQMGFFNSLFYDGTYLWGDWGVKADDGNLFNGPYVSMDAFQVGIDWYTHLIPALNQAGRALICCDYTVNGNRFSYNETERLISRRGSAHLNNSYFNQSAAATRGFAIVIPGTDPAIVYCDPYASPLVSQQVTVHYDNNDFNLGTIPGMTLYVS